jgi:ABC-type hemin transport system substrate-binding protein
LQFALHGFSPFQKRFNALDVLKLRKVSVGTSNSTEGLEGLGMGVNAIGEFLVQTEQGQVTINSSEVSVKPL